MTHTTEPTLTTRNYQGDLNRTLYITNLDPKVREKDLVAYFSRYGPTSVVKIVRDRVSGKSLSYGFVEFVEANDALTARYESQYKKIERREILVMFISERHQLVPEAKVFIKNISPCTSIQKLHDIFREVSVKLFVHINTDEKGKRLDFGFVHYKTKEDACTALERFKNLELDGQRIHLSRWVGKETRQASQQESKKNLYIRNLPLIKKKIIERSLTILLLPFGDIESMLVKKAPSFNINYALVSFTTPESAQRAMKELSERPTFLEGSREPLNISWYQRRSERDHIKDHEMNAIFCGNLKMSITTLMVKNALSSFGSIVKVNLCSGESVDGKEMTRCGHVVFEYASSAEAAFHECKLSGDFQNLFVGEPELELTRYKNNNEPKAIQKPQKRRSSKTLIDQRVPVQEEPLKAVNKNNKKGNNGDMVPQAYMNPYYPNPNMYYPCYNPMNYYYPMATPYGYPAMYNPNMMMMMNPQGDQNAMMNNNNNTANNLQNSQNASAEKKEVKKNSGTSSVGSLSTLDDCHLEGEGSEKSEMSVTEGNSSTEGSDSTEMEFRDFKVDGKNEKKSRGSHNIWKTKRKYGIQRPRVVELVENAE